MMDDFEKYIKDNPKGYWFKNKIYGWGWFPVKWQGWVVILVFVIAITLNSIRFDLTNNESTTALTSFLLQTFALALILITVCYIKGEKPRWQWGLPKDKNK